MLVFYFIFVAVGAIIMKERAENRRLQAKIAKQELAEVQRAVVTLRMLDDVVGEDVARQLGLTPGHVAVLLHRAKGQLITCMRR